MENSPPTASRARGLKQVLPIPTIKLTLGKSRPRTYTQLVKGGSGTPNFTVTLFFTKDYRLGVGSTRLHPHPSVIIVVYRHSSVLRFRTRPPVELRGRGLHRRYLKTLNLKPEIIIRLMSWRDLG